MILSYCYRNQIYAFSPQYSAPAVCFSVTESFFFFLFLLTSRINAVHVVYAWFFVILAANAC